MLLNRYNSNRVIRYITAMVIVISMALTCSPLKDRTNIRDPLSPNYQMPTNNSSGGGDEYHDGAVITGTVVWKRNELHPIVGTLLIAVGGSLTIEGGSLVLLYGAAPRLIVDGVLKLDGTYATPITCMNIDDAPGKIIFRHSARNSAIRFTRMTNMTVECRSSGVIIERSKIKQITLQGAAAPTIRYNRVGYMEFRDNTTAIVQYCHFDRDFGGQTPIAGRSNFLNVFASNLQLGNSRPRLTHCNILGYSPAPVSEGHYAVWNTSQPKTNSIIIINSYWRTNYHGFIATNLCNHDPGLIAVPLQSISNHALSSAGPGW